MSSFSASCASFFPVICLALRSKSWQYGTKQWDQHRLSHSEIACFLHTCDLQLCTSIAVFRGWKNPNCKALILCYIFEMHSDTSLLILKWNKFWGFSFFSFASISCIALAWTLGRWVLMKASEWNGLLGGGLVPTSIHNFFPFQVTVAMEGSN